MGSKRDRWLAEANNGLKAKLFDMEPDLRQLEGLIANLRVLSEAREAIEPSALSVLAECGGLSVERLQQGFREGLAGLSGNTTNIGQKARNRLD